MAAKGNMQNQHETPPNINKQYGRHKTVVAWTWFLTFLDFETIIWILAQIVDEQWGSSQNV